MAQDIQLKGQYYLTLAQYNAKKEAGELIVGAQYYITDEADFESTDNKVTSISSSSTDTQYPSAKLLYDLLQLKLDTLPTVINDKYLHTNSSTGALEWTEVQGGVTSVNGQTGDVVLTIPSKTSDLTNDSDFITSSYHDSTKLNTLVSGTSIKTINGASVLGSGDLTVSATGATVVQTTGQNTDLVMSQKAVTDNLSYATADLVSVPPTSRFANQVTSTLTSLYTYSISDLYNVSMLVKTGGIGNHYAHGTIIGIQKDTNNYLSLYISGYVMKFDNKVAGTVVNTQTISSNINSDINKYSCYYAKIDLYNKILYVDTIISDALYNVATFDFSSWDISALDTVYLIQSISDYTNATNALHIRINSYYDKETLLKYSYDYGNYNSLEVFNKADTLLVPMSGLRLGGTITETISAYHKKATASYSALTYFALGYIPTTNTKWNSYSVKFKITDSTDPLIKSGAGSNTVLLFLGDTLVANLNTATYSLEEDVEYTLQVRVDIQTSGYVTQYAVKFNGAFTIEAYDPLAYYELALNICSETYNGNVFAGVIPFTFDAVTFTNTYTATSTHGTPLKQITIDASGNISMWNGSAWKRINNA